MKPDWKDAPDWAKYLTQDKSGTWWWWAKEPKVNEDLDVWEALCEGERATPIINWKQSLQKRPEQ